MKCKLLTLICLSIGLVNTSLFAKSNIDTTLNPAANLSIMKRVADWQIGNLEYKGWKHGKTDWTYGALYAGMFKFSRWANDAKYQNWLVQIGKDNDWNTGPRRFFADDYCVGQTYSQLSRVYKDTNMISLWKRQADSIIAAPHDVSLDWVNHVHMKEWAWCDALFMGPPALAYLATATGERKYLDIADKLWWKTTAYLYDTDEHLYFRDQRYFGKKEANGKKVFWSRGNGWVMGGLVRVLDNMPTDYPARSKYIRLYKEMAVKVASLQAEDGTWRAALLDPDNYPSKETSGTGFFCYALAWGINHGILSKDEFLPVVTKAWNALRGCVQKNGKLGFVQVIAAAPGHATADDTEVYGIGAFLLAGSEMIRLAENELKLHALLLENNLGVERNDLVEIDYPAFAKAMGTSGNKPFKLLNVLTGEEIPYQVSYEGAKKAQQILLLAPLVPAGKMLIVKEDAAATKIEPKVYGRYVPERKDDFAWENERVAFRMYGKALEATNENAFGIDVWSKRTTNLVINRWYKTNDYHHDNGEGMDYYSVGFSLGAGDMAPVIGDSIIYSKNYRKYQVLDQGPLRFTFRLEYDAWTVGDNSVKVSKTISLDAGSQLNKCQVVYSYKGKQSLPVVIGIVKRKDPGTFLLNERQGSMAYWEPAHGNDGITGVASILPSGNKGLSVDHQHLKIATTANSGETITYFTGAAWSKGGLYTNSKEWFKYVDQFAAKLQFPVTVVLPSK
ncbi:hypothetical protein COR50_00500 [Chitinophaga caeni]|uniref:DUF4861 domain-containing protein n=2 Tax=Chitinophaga caeni TaxID=2029983 RepID=A0A291QP36_9BACT|nr:hypothetical protein COR50_00500 [Chitinophaga caeni]